MWKPMQKQIIPIEHGITWIKYTIDPRIKIWVGKGIPTNNIILLVLFNKVFSNIVVCTSFDIVVQVFQEDDLKGALSENWH
jgi:hypothetical protein